MSELFHEARMLEAARRQMGRMLAPLEIGAPRFRPYDLEGALTVYDSLQERFCVPGKEWTAQEAQEAADGFNRVPSVAELWTWWSARECL